MKILYIVPEFDPNAGGGIATFYRHLLPAMSKLGHQIDVCVTNPFGCQTGPADIPGVMVRSPNQKHFQAAKELLAAHSAVPELFNHLVAAYAGWIACDEGRDFDVIETTDWGLLFAPWLASAKRPPTIVQLHASNGQVSAHDPRIGSGLYGAMSRLIETALLPRAEELQTYGSPNQTDWMKLLDRNVRLIPPAWEPNPINSCELLASAREPYGLVVGRIQTWKGVETLCKAIKKIGSPAPRILWVGRDMPARNGKALSSILAAEYPEVWGKSIIPIGSLPRDLTARLQQSAKFVVVPSTWDVYNLTAAESMGCERVVICSSGAGASDLIQPNENGFNFPSGNDEALAEKLCIVANMDDKTTSQIGSAARKTVQNELNPDRIALIRARRYEEIAASPIHQYSDHEWLSRMFADKSHSTENPLSMLDRFPLRKIGRYLSNRLFRKILGEKRG